MYSPQLIALYIEFAKDAIKEHRFFVENRKKNNQTLMDLNLTPKDVFDILMSLEVSDYFDGPSPDRDRPGTPDFWIFKKSVYGKTLYIKMKIEMIDETKNLAKVVSFHIDETL